jgi:metal-dependent amidase/aminoacylase/carboxypeptidase family protein
MKRIILATVAAAALFGAAQAQAQTQAQTQARDAALKAAVQADYQANLGSLFDWFHRNPELSGREVQTSARMARELTALGYEVTTGVGGTGVVAVLRNGTGPTVMIRADMDGLPLEERSGLANASTARQVDADGTEKPVMHACGHDVHITALVGTARQMAARKANWSGTLVLIAQPAEERIFGARAMIDDGLYSRFPKPDYALAFHVSADLAAGGVADRGVVADPAQPRGQSAGGGGGDGRRHPRRHQAQHHLRTGRPATDRAG